MSTEYYVSHHAIDAAKTDAAKNFRADTANNRSTLELLVALDSIDPIGNDNWEINVINHDGSEVIRENLSWKCLARELTASDIFRALAIRRPVQPMI